jgi:hypothetical protein
MRLQKLFAHIRMIYRKPKLRETALNEFRKYIQPQNEPQKFIDEILKPYSDALQIIKTGTYQSDRHAEAVNSLFRWLNQIDNFDWVPPAIVYLSQNRHSPEKLKQFFSDLERLAAGLMILRADINERIEQYGRLLTAIQTGGNLQEVDSPRQLTTDEARRIMETLKWRSIPDEKNSAVRSTTPGLFACTGGGGLRLPNHLCRACTPAKPEQVQCMG